MEAYLLEKIAFFNKKFKCKVKLKFKGICCLYCNKRHNVIIDDSFNFKLCRCYFEIYLGIEHCANYICSYSFINKLYDILNIKKSHRVFYDTNDFIPILFKKNIYCPKLVLGDKTYGSHLYASYTLKALWYRNKRIQTSIKKSVLFSIWCLKKSGLYKDMASLVGKYVWKSRGRVEFWLKDKFYLF